MGNDGLGIVDVECSRCAMMSLDSGVAELKTWSYSMDMVKTKMLTTLVQTDVFVSGRKK